MVGTLSHYTYFAFAPRTGSGFLFILDLTPDNRLVPAAQMQWTDGLFDLAFAEDHPDVVLTASGCGGIQLWDIKTPQVHVSNYFCVGNNLY